MASPMRPPSASISRTRWPLAVPPIAGLQGICPTVSSESVTSATWQPRRAAAQAASTARRGRRRRRRRRTCNGASFADAEPLENMRAERRRSSRPTISSNRSRALLQIGEQRTLPAPLSASVRPRSRAPRASSSRATCRTLEMAGEIARRIRAAKRPHDREAQRIEAGAGAALTRPQRPCATSRSDRGIGLVLDDQPWRAHASRRAAAIVGRQRLALIEHDEHEFRAPRAPALRARRLRARSGRWCRARPPCPRASAQAPDVTRSATRSRVVPGTSVTMARSAPTAR